MALKIFDKYSSSFWLILLLIYCSEDTLLFGTNSNMLFVNLHYVFEFLIAFIFCRNISRDSYKVIFLLLLSFIFSACITGFSLGFLSNMLIFVMCVAVASFISFDTFKKIFTECVFYLLIFCLVAYFIQFFYPAFFNYFPTFTNKGELSFYNLFVTVFPEINSLRLWGIFREPGVTMIYANIALFFELTSPKVSKIKVLIFVLSILFTLSTAGYLILFANMVLFLLRTKMNKFGKIIIIGIFSIALFYLLNDEIINANLFRKITDQTDSYTARVSSIIVPLKIFFEHPLGVGPDEYDVLFPQYTSLMYGVSIAPEISTNTLLKLLAVYGPFVFAIYLILFFKFCRKVSHSAIDCIFCLTIILLCISNEDLRTSVLFNILIAYGLVIPKNSQNNYENSIN